MARRYKLWLCLPPAVVTIADVILTLVGQPARYWAGDYARASEISPGWQWFLKQHPVALVAGNSIYLIFVCALIVFVPNKIARVVCVATVVAHATGIANWSRFLGVNELCLSFVFLLLGAMILFSLDRSEESRARQMESIVA